MGSTDPRAKFWPGGMTEEAREQWRMRPGACHALTAWGIDACRYDGFEHYLDVILYTTQHGAPISREDWQIVVDQVGSNPRMLDPADWLGIPDGLHKEFKDFKNGVGFEITD